MMKIDQDSPQVKIPPPLISLFFILSGYGLGQLNPLPLPLILKPAGYFFLVLGLFIIARSASLFKRSRTKLEPWKTTSAIVTTGVYRFSRNPIYLSFVFIGVGVAFLTSKAWILIMQVPFIIVMSYYVIRKEENYLSEKFGLTYTSYADRVRRWL
jgi:protein-S-isoprenylcysteine O-methyltransferase Ste14